MEAKVTLLSKCLFKNETEWKQSGVSLLGHSVCAFDSWVIVLTLFYVSKSNVVGGCNENSMPVE